MKKERKTGIYPAHRTEIIYLECPDCERLIIVSDESTKEFMERWEEQRKQTKK